MFTFCIRLCPSAFFLMFFLFLFVCLRILLRRDHWSRTSEDLVNSQSWDSNEGTVYSSFIIVTVWYVGLAVIMAVTVWIPVQNSPRPWSRSVEARLRLSLLFLYKVGKNWVLSDLVLMFFKLLPKLSLTVIRTYSVFQSKWYKSMLGMIFNTWQGCEIKKRFLWNFSHTPLNEWLKFQ